VKRLRWESPDSRRPVPKHPYRDTVLLYGALAVVVVVIAAATGGSVAKAVITAVIVFVVATAWSWRTWRNRLREERARDAEGPQ
jgi:membrane protein implicated in regulation of membrane protease activity